MTRHLTMDELLALRAGEGGSAVRAHLASCADCAAELERVAQRVAALKALRPARASRDRWPVVRSRIAAERRKRWVRRGTLMVTAVAASLALTLGLMSRGERGLPAAVEGPAIEAWQAQSQELEGLLAAYAGGGRVVDGRTAAVIADLEDRIALVDAGLMQARRVNAPVTDVAELWRGRVELMNALVSAHTTRTSYVGF
ncbi:MAG: hypothetical protein WD934_01590 [Gemmatimonadales bacterium]